MLFKTDTVFIVKGEIPAMLMTQMGYLACAPTGGEAGSNISWRTALALAPKVVIGDNDEPGRRLGAKRAEFFGAVVYFPPDPYKDVDAWILGDPQTAVKMLDAWKQKTLEEWW